MKTRYCLGFMFSSGLDKEVMLIRKNKPDWQKGKLNGVGGKVETGETPLDAMIRECYEETSIVHNEWDFVCTLIGEDWEVSVFMTISDKIYSYQNLTPETISIEYVSMIPNIVHKLSNLSWLIPMCLDDNDGLGEINYGIKRDIF